MPVVDAIEAYFEVRAPLRESEHTTRAYRGDLRSLLDVAACELGKDRRAVTVTELAPLPVMRQVYGVWCAQRPQGSPRAVRSIRRMHSTWTGFFEFLVGDELVPGSPWPGIKLPALPKRQPKPFSREAAGQIVQAVQDGAVERRDPWPELDRAIVLVDLVTGARTAELLGANVGDVNRTRGSEAIRLLGKGDQERTVPLEPVLLDVLGAYLDTRRARFPHLARKRGVEEGASPWDWWAPDAPLFVDRRGERLRDGALRYMIKLIYRAAGVEALKPSGAATHAMRHTAATANAESGMTVVELMQMFGWRSLSTPQNYVDATAREIRRAAAQNPVYGLLAEPGDEGAA
jgi:integrase/recombinase XerD